MLRPRTLRTVGALAVCLALAVCAVVVAGDRDARAAAVRASVPTGSPDAGRSLFSSLGCGSCHALDPAATVPTTGPALTRPTLEGRARDARKAVGPFIAESIVSPPADPSPGWVSSVMPFYAELRPRQLDDLVSFLLGEPYSGSGPAGAPLPADPVKACTARTSCRATVARWTRVVRLPKAVVPGAKVLAVAGCLSCHTYAGSGTVGAAPDLTRQGLKQRRSVSSLARWVGCARCIDSGVEMPSFAALGQANLRRVAELLAASKGARG
jgi:mono/diheme cytochrome c family protein